MSDKKQESKNGDTFAAFNKEVLNAEIPDSLVKQLKQSLDGFRQDLRFHPYVTKQKRGESSKWQRILPRPHILAWSSVLAIAVLICVTIGMSFFLGKSTPTWAEVNKGFGSVSVYSGSYYLRKRSFLDSTKQYFVSDRIIGQFIDSTIQIEYWLGSDNRIRLIMDRTVTFAKKGGFIKTFALDTRKEIIPDIMTLWFLEMRGFGGYFKFAHKPSPNRYDFGALFLGRIDDTTTFVNTHTEISKDLVVFDVESDEGTMGQWRYRVWALRSSKLPIRVIGRNSAGAREDNVYSYIKEQPKEFFDPEIFEAKLKDPTNGVVSLLYMGLDDVRGKSIPSPGRSKGLN